MQQQGEPSPPPSPRALAPRHRRHATLQVSRELLVTVSREAAQATAAAWRSAAFSRDLLWFGIVAGLAAMVLWERQNTADWRAVAQRCCDRK